MSERGSVLPALAVVLLGGLLATMLAVEVGQLAATHRAVAFAAGAAAEAGASMLSVDAAAAGELALDPLLAEDSAVETALSDGEDREAEAAATVERVCVTVTQVFRPRLLAAIGIPETPVTATACASPAQG